MNVSPAPTLAPHPSPSLIERCRAIGVTLLLCDDRGRIIRQYIEPDAWLDRTVVASPLLQVALSRQSETWGGQERPVPAELSPGCWTLPLPIVSRRRRTGYLVALMLTPAFLRTEQFIRLCDQARLDRRAVLKRVDRHTLARPEEVMRCAHLLNWMADDLEQLDHRGGEVISLSQQLGETYEELNLVYKLAANMTVTQDPEEFLTEACAELQQVVGLKWVAVQLHSQERISAIRGRLFLAGSSPRCDTFLSHVGCKLMQQLDPQGGPRIYNEIADADIPELAQVAERMIVVPLIREGQWRGVLMGADKPAGGELSSVDGKLVTSLSHNICIFLDNALLYEDMQDMFMGTLHALVNSIDAKDSYTCGHSERVAWLSRQLAEAAGLDAAQIERIYLAGLVHDIGKIGIPEAVLCKAGQLTEEEFNIIKTHPEIGARILRDIRQMQDLVPGTLYHHERFDGKGYPHGLAGRDIPIFGRLICLADSYDAMSSNRTYRQAMPHEKVLSEIRRCAGTQFDPDLASVFVQLDLSSYQDMVNSHQKRESPLIQALRRSA